ncbi:hypothetical protein J3459_009928 [Metarhizium acridum]|nr:hypothetical protein J3459_009928 [Metarhizium acridum]
MRTSLVFNNSSCHVCLVATQHAIDARATQHQNSSLPLSTEGKSQPAPPTRDTKWGFIRTTRPMDWPKTSPAWAVDSPYFDGRECRHTRLGEESFVVLVLCVPRRGVAGGRAQVSC